MNNTPLKSIHAFCVSCVGASHEVRDCGGDKMAGTQGDGKHICFFFPYRAGRGATLVKHIRKFCLECMG